MRFRLYTLIVCMMLAVYATGCALHHEDAVIVWSWDIAANALQQLVPAFERSHAGVHVKVIDLGHPQVFERGMAGCAAGGVGLPDVYTVENSDAEAFWTRFPGSFTNLADLGAQQLTSDFPLFKWAALTVDQKIFAIPWDAGPVVVFYRRDLYARAGIDVKSIRTWDDFTEAGHKLLAATGGRVHMATLGRGLDDDWFRMLCSQNDSYYFDASGQFITVNQPGCVRALETIKKLADAGVLVYGGWTEQIQAIKSSTVASALYGAWYEGTIRTNAPDESGKWGVYRMPASQAGGRRAANIGGSALAIPASSDKKTMAYEFIRYALATRPSQISMLQNYGLVPAYLPALKDPYVHAPVRYWGDQAIWALILGTLQEIPVTRNTEYFTETRAIMATLLGDYLDGRYASAQACLDEAAKEMSAATGLPVAPLKGAP